MKKQAFDSCGITIELEVPETLEEAQKLCEHIPGGVLPIFIDHVVYHGLLGKFRTKFTDKVVAETNFEPEKDSKGKRKDSDGVVLKSAVAFAECDITDFQEEGQKIADEIKFEVKPPRAPAQPKKLAAEYKNTAQMVINQGKQDAVAAKLIELNPGLEVDANDVESLGRAISANESRKRREAKAKMAQAYQNLEI